MGNIYFMCPCNKVCWVFLENNHVTHFQPKFPRVKTCIFGLVLVSLDRLFSYLFNETKIVQIRGDLEKLWTKLLRGYQWMIEIVFLESCVLESLLSFSSSGFIKAVFSKFYVLENLTSKFRIFKKFLILASF